MVEEDRWPSRQMLAATFIAPNSSVVDIGAGAQGLRDRLPPGCTYLGLDLPEFDANTDAFPSADVAVMLGVFERVADPGGVLRRLRPAVHQVLFSYVHGGRRGKLRDWNDLSVEDVEQIADAAGFESRIVATWKFTRPQTIWLLW
jgi:hypothetical protein